MTEALLYPTGRKNGARRGSLSNEGLGPILKELFSVTLSFPVALDVPHK